MRKAIAGIAVLIAAALAVNANVPDDIPWDTLNRILWWDSRGHDTPYPKLW